LVGGGTYMNDLDQENLEKTIKALDILDSFLIFLEDISSAEIVAARKFISANIGHQDITPLLHTNDDFCIDYTHKYDC